MVELADVLNNNTVVVCRFMIASTHCSWCAYGSFTKVECLFDCNEIVVGGEEK